MLNFCVLIAKRTYEFSKYLFISLFSYHHHDHQKTKLRFKIKTEYKQKQHTVRSTKRKTREKKEDRLQMVWFVDAVPMEKWSG